MYLARVVRAGGLVSTQAKKAKGRRFQQTTVAMMYKAFPTLEQYDIRSTPMGASGDDVMLSPTALKLLPYKFEMKNVESISVWRAIAQVIHRTKRSTMGLTPCVVLGKNHTKPIAVIPLSHWGNLLGTPTTNATAPATTTPLRAGATLPHWATYTELAEALDGPAPPFHWPPSGGKPDLAEQALVWATEQVWHGQRALPTAEGSASPGFVLEDTALGSWRVRVWSKPHLNIWRLYPEVVKEAKKESLKRNRALRKVAEAPATDQHGHLLSHFQPQIPLIVFGRPDAGQEDMPVWVALPFDTFLGIVSARSVANSTPQFKVDAS
eukprot:m.184573 g.184573  ORF g.184573 m.184573 type:complete len:323 (-) comp24705_c1_seq1:372-1340(-)